MYHAISMAVSHFCARCKPVCGKWGVRCAFVSVCVGHGPKSNHSIFHKGDNMWSINALHSIPFGSCHCAEDYRTDGTESVCKRERVVQVPGPPGSQSSECHTPTHVGERNVGRDSCMCERLSDLNFQCINRSQS